MRCCNAPTLEFALKRQAEVVLRHLLTEVHRLGSELSMSEMLTGITPDKTDAVLQRAHAFGQSRVICGVHWQSDVDNGRVMGASAVARLQSDPVFTAQVALARQEVADARARGAKSPLNCTAEKAALGR